MSKLLNRDKVIKDKTLIILQDKEIIIAFEYIIKLHNRCRIEASTKLVWLIYQYYWLHRTHSAGKHGTRRKQCDCFFASELFSVRLCSVVSGYVNWNDNETAVTVRCDFFSANDVHCCPLSSIIHIFSLILELTRWHCLRTQ